MVNPAGSTKIADMTLDELRAIVREEMRQVVQEMMADLADAEDDMPFRPEIAAWLRDYLRERPDGEDADDVVTFG